MAIEKRFNFFGTLINATNLQDTTRFLMNYDFGQVGYVSFPDSSVVALAQNDKTLQAILNRSLLTLPDGKPSEFYARIMGYSHVSTVSGYWLCNNMLNTDLTHYFLGSTEEKLHLIRSFVTKNYPYAKVFGYSAPPFNDVDYFKRGELLDNELEKINALNPDLIWVGISSPKQDFLMQSHYIKLKHGVMLGVGGVFDYLSGEVEKSPEWIKKIGLRWLWRLMKEPRRLGPKYASTAMTFTRMLIKVMLVKLTLMKSE